MKKLLYFFLTVILCAFLCGTVNAAAEDEIVTLPVDQFVSSASDTTTAPVCGLDMLEYEISDGEVSITGYKDGISGTVIIPSYIEEYPVTNLSHQLFYECKDITSVVLPDTLKKIGIRTFMGCTSLGSVNIPDGVTEIGSYAFYGCTSLESIIIPDSVNTLGTYVFTTSGLKQLSIGDGITQIDTNTFTNCTALEKVSFGRGISSINNVAFSYCKNISEITVDENNPTYYSKGNCLIEKAGSRLVLGGKGSVIPGEVKIIGNRAFFGSGITELVVPEGVVKIEEYAFYECVDLKNVLIFDTVTEIGANAFRDCDAVYSMTLPFAGNKVDSEVKGYLGYAFGATSASDNDLYVPQSLKEVTVTKKIHPEAFRECRNITKITISEGIDEIGMGAFQLCTGLTEMNIPSSVTLINRSAFSGCSGIKELTIPDNVETIQSGIIRDCTSLEKLTVPFIGSTIDDTEMTFLCHFYGYSASYRNYDIPVALKEVSVTKTTTIGKDAFRGCQNIERVLLNSNVTTIGEYAFLRCFALENIEIPQSVRTVGAYAFSGCRKITSIVLPEGITAIETHAISMCESLTSVTIPSTVTKISELAFYDCKRLTNVYFGGSQQQWNNISVGRDNEPLINATKYFNGTSAEGWVQENGNWVFYENGIKVTDTWKLDSVGWCYLDSKGTMATNQWIMDSVGWCYVGGDGYCVTNCWQQDSNGWCYLDSTGRMATDQWIKDSVGWCYVGSDGYCVTNSWMADSIGWCYLDSNGRMATNQWIMDSVGWCYVGADGYCVTNSWMADSIGWCYLDENGRMVVNDYVYDSNGKCYLDESGYWNGEYV